MRYTPILCALALALLAAPSFAADDILIEQVIGKEHPGQYKHPASVTQRNNGDLLATYYGGDGEYEDNSTVWGIRDTVILVSFREEAVLGHTK